MAEEIVFDIDAMATGCIPAPEVLASCGMPAYAGRSIPSQDWRSTDAMRRFVPRGKCQSSIPACNWYAALKAWQTKYAVITGGPYPEVSYIANYAEDTGNNFNVGTMPLDAIRQMVDRGIIPVGDGMPEWFDRPRRVPPEIAARRMSYRADEWNQLFTVEDFVSAILNMDPIDFGMKWYDTDVNPGPTGRLRLRGNRELGGHALTGCFLDMAYAPSPSGIGLGFSNHHGDSKVPAKRDERGNTLTFPIWGDDGFGIVPIERAVADARMYGAFALRTVYVRPEDISDVPLPKFPDAAKAA